MMKRKSKGDKIFITLFILSYFPAFFLGVAVTEYLEHRVGINGAALILPLGALLIWFGYMWRESVENRDK